jgi:hypothetical protein
MPTGLNSGQKISGAKSGAILLLCSLYIAVIANQHWLGIAGILLQWLVFPAALLFVSGEGLTSFVRIRFNTRDSVMWCSTLILGHLCVFAVVSPLTGFDPQGILNLPKIKGTAILFVAVVQVFIAVSEELLKLSLYVAAISLMPQGRSCVHLSVVFVAAVFSAAHIFAWGWPASLPLFINSVIDMEFWTRHRDFRFMVMVHAVNNTVLSLLRIEEYGLAVFVLVILIMSALFLSRLGSIRECKSIHSSIPGQHLKSS